MNRIPVEIVSGFLGAGKTTLLNHVLNGTHGQRIAVLVNDFGEINIDAQLITHVDGETISLANGCVCCTIRDDLVQAVSDLTERHPLPDSILIETSGVSDPTAAAMGIATSTKLSPVVQMDAIVTVVDAENALALEGNLKALAVDQIEGAHILIINKTDLVSAGAVAEIRSWIREISPRARIIETSNCEVPTELIFGTARQRLDTGNESHETATLHALEHSHDEHSTAFAAWSWVSEEPLAFQAIYELFKTLPLSIFRAKGIVYLSEVPDRRVILQMVGPRVTLSKGEPWNHVQPRSQIVVIGIAGEFDGKKLTGQFNASISSNAEPQPNRLAEAVVEILRRP